MYKIGISGKSGVGKNAFCKILVDLISDRYSSYEIKSLSFADPIKKIALILFPQIPKEHLYGDSELRNKPIDGVFLNGKPVLVRDILIDIGESYKKYNKNIFVDIFHEKTKKFCEPGTKSKFLFATDLRFPQEFDYMKSNNFKTIRIIRDSSIKSKDFTETVQDTITSESFDFIINNDGNLAELRQKAESLLRSVI